MGIKATAVVKKETKIDPKKPNDKAYYASLSVLNEDGKEYGLPRHLGEFREVAVLLKREGGVTHEQLHESFAAYERGEEISIPELPEDQPTCVHFAQCARCETEFTYMPDCDWVTVVYPGCGPDDERRSATATPLINDSFPALLMIRRFKAGIPSSHLRKNEIKNCFLPQE